MKFKIMIIPETDKELEETLAFVKNKKAGSDTKQEELPSQDNVCSKCGEKVTPKVEDYSQNKYGKVLCYNCQQKGES